MIFPVELLIQAIERQKYLSKLPYHQLPIEERERLMARRLREAQLKLLEQEVAMLEKLLHTPNQEPKSP